MGISTDTGIGISIGKGISISRGIGISICISITIGIGIGIGIGKGIGTSLCCLCLCPDKTYLNERRQASRQVAGEAGWRQGGKERTKANNAEGKQLLHPETLTFVQRQKSPVTVTNWHL